MGCIAAERQIEGQISSGSFHLTAVRQTVFISGWAVANQLLGKQSW